MRTKVRFVMYASENDALELFDVVHQKTKQKLGDMFHIEVFKDAPEYHALLQAIAEKGIHVSLVHEEPVFSEKERLESPILRIIPNAYHGGYPQPENPPNYLDVSLDWTVCSCPNCTIGIKQKKPLRLKSGTKLGRSDISGIWWLRENFVISKELKDKIEGSGLTGVEIWPIIKHGKNEEFSDIFQLKIVGSLPPMDPATDIRFKRESDIGIKTCPNGCGMRSMKGLVHYREKDVKITPDFMLTTEWFGSYHSYWRAPCLSQRAYRFFKEWGVKGVRYVPVKIVK